MGRLQIEDLEKIKEKVVRDEVLGTNGMRARVIVHLGTCGISSGADKVLSVLEGEVQEKAMQDVKIKSTGCIGFCSREPLLTVEVVNEEPVEYQYVDEEVVREIVASHLLQGKVLESHVLGSGDFMNTLPFFKHQMSIVLRNRGKIDPFLIDDYIACGGYEALAKVLTSLNPDTIIETVRNSGLKGRGGGGFLTGMKWQFAASAEGDVKYVLCNADEGDPGAYMDRSVLEGDPHAVLEGMIIAAKAIGARQGYIYCRAEYPLAVKTLRNAIDQAKEYGLLGENIFGTGFDFELDIYMGAGAFVCGEETALMASIQGERGMPRPRPPFPANKGLWNRPTILNNVETFANIPQIIVNGADWYANIGTEGSKGTKVFALTGAVNNIGLVEVPMGTTLGQIIYEIGGGIPDGKQYKAAQLGGPSGGCIPAQYVDLPTDYAAIVEAGAIMGSGGLIVMDEDTCMVDMARFFMDFVQDESCGKCTPCREGTKRMLELLKKITEGKGEEGDIELLLELAYMVKDSALCGLGQTGPNPVLSTLRYFEDEYIAHIKEKRCPAFICKPLISYYIEPTKCQACMTCFKNCPSEAIEGEKNQIHVINQEKCIKCGICFQMCPPRFGAVTRISGKPVPWPLPLDQRTVVRKKKKKEKGSIEKDDETDE